MKQTTIITNLTIWIIISIIYFTFPYKVLMVITIVLLSIIPIFFILLWGERLYSHFYPGEPLPILKAYLRHDIIQPDGSTIIRIKNAIDNEEGDELYTDKEFDLKIKNLTDGLDEKELLEFKKYHYLHDTTNEFNERIK